MGSGEIIAIILISLIIIGAGAYIFKAKKSGKRCIGCPDSDVCSSRKCSGSCSSCQGACHSKCEQNSEEK